MTPEASEPGNDTRDLSSILNLMVAELEASASQCTALQWSISNLLEKIDHPDLGEEIHMLQHIDRLQQTLADIASVVRVVADCPHQIALPVDTIGAAIRLESFRTRIGLGHDALGDQSSGSWRDHDIETDVTWL